MMNRLIRPFGYWFFLAMLVLEARGISCAPGIFAYFIISALTLGGGEALRLALARTVSRARAAGTVLTAFLLLVPLTAAVCFLRPPLSVLPGALLVALRLMEEHFRAGGDRLSPFLTDFLAALSLPVAAAFDVSPAWPLAAILLLTLLLALVGRHRAPDSRDGVPVVARQASLRPNLDLFKAAPVGLLRTLLAPALLAAVLRIHHSGDLVFPLLGLALLEFFRSDFRRDDRETPALTLPVALIALAATLLPISAPGVAALTLSCATIFALYARLSVRTGLMALLLLIPAALPLIPTEYAFDFIPALCAALTLALALPDLRGLLRSVRASALRRRARRNAKGGFSR